MDAAVENKEKEKEQKFLDQFEHYDHPELTDRVSAVRNEGKEALQSLSFPTTKWERWKYTRVKKILNGQFSYQPLNKEIDVTPYVLKDTAAYQLVFVNGFFRADLSDTLQVDGVTISALSSLPDGAAHELDQHYGVYADHRNEPFTALNAAYVTDGAFVHVKGGKAPEQPIHVINLVTGNGATSQQRNVLVAEKGAELQVVQSFHTLDGEKQFNNVVTEGFVGKNAGLTYYKLQNEGGSTYQIATDQIHQERDSRFHIGTFTLGGGLLRNDLNMVLTEENSNTELYGLYMLRGKAHADNHTFVHHRVPNCYSNELYKGIMDEKSTGVFNGKVFVDSVAQQTDAYQSNANILLSEDAVIHTKPELEIYADDVSCSHGATTGQLDEEALFYLRSRGLSKEKAQKVLLRAFAGEVLDQIRIEGFRNKLEEVLADRFE